MDIKYYNGDVLTSNADVIMHQVNCQGSFNSGVAKAVKDKYIDVYNQYSSFCKTQKSKDLLGQVLYVKIDEDRYIANLFGQEFYGYKGGKYTSYDAIDKCLKNVAENAVNAGVKTIALPFKMSSDRGGADWDVILALIKSAFNNTDITIEIWKFNN